jgi:3-phosphoshikimate 1-carboxyvinyltransferase
MSRTAHSGLRLQRGPALQGALQVPGDKSISHRAALLAALAHGRTTIRGYVRNRDCLATLCCLERLGVPVEWQGDAVVIEGQDRHALTSPEAELDASNSGTTMRLVAGLVAGLPIDAVITGDASLRRRPMERVARPLREMGAEVSTDSGRAPLHIRGRFPLRPIHYRPEVASAQLKSCVLLAGLAATGRTQIDEPVRSRDHTERLLQAFGAETGAAASGPWIEGPSRLAGTFVDVPGDFSSAAFLLGMAIVVEGSFLTIKRVGLNPTRTRLLDVMMKLGADVEVAAVDSDQTEPFGDLLVRYTERLEPASRLTLDAHTVAELIDEVPLLAVLAARTEGGIRFDGVGELRHKESDRVAALASGLRRMGAEVEESADSLYVPGPQRLRGARVESAGDHRIAMAFACAAMFADGITEIGDPDCVDVSFPGFFELLPEGCLAD